MKKLIFFLLLYSCIIKIHAVYVYKVKSGFIEYYLINKLTGTDTIAHFNYYFEEFGKKGTLTRTIKNKIDTFLIDDSSLYKQRNDSFYQYAKFDNIINTFYELDGKKLDFSFYKDVKKYRKKKKFYKGYYVTRHISFGVPYQYVGGRVLYEYKGLPVQIGTLVSDKPGQVIYAYGLHSVQFKFKRNEFMHTHLMKCMNLIVK